MRRALFISDIHITSPEDPKYALFLRLLDKLLGQAPADLFLVGDIFDLWISDRSYFVNRYAEAIEKLRALRRSGFRVLYFEGNHDLDLKRFWEKQLGAEVFEGPAHFELGGVLVRVEHGDQMNPKDTGYRFLRWLLRTPVLKLLERYLPNPFVRWIGERASRASRDYTSNAKSVSGDEARACVRQHAALVHKTQAFNILVCGHLHVRMDEATDAYRMINLSSWLSEPLLFQMAGQETALIPVEEWLAR